MGFISETGTICDHIPTILENQYTKFNEKVKGNIKKLLLYISDSAFYSGQCVKNFNLYWGRDVTDDEKYRIAYCTFLKKVGSSNMSGIYLRNKDHCGNVCKLFGELEKLMPYQPEIKDGYRTYNGNIESRVNDLISALEKLKTQLGNDIKPYYNSAYVRNRLQKEKVEEDQSKED